MAHHACGLFLWVELKRPLPTARVWTSARGLSSLPGFHGVGRRVISTIFENLFVSQNIVHVGATLCLLGFLFRNQLILRLLVLGGDCVYILYYYFAPEVPLWGAIFWSTMFTIVNVVMIWRIFMDEMQSSLPASERKLFELLVDLTPGQFRKFLKAGRQEVTAAPLVITRENEPLQQLYFISEGRVIIEKGGHRVTSDAKTFIGEIAFLLGRPATATVTLEPGCHYGVWDSKVLCSVLNGHAELKNALSAAMNRKLAEKVAQAGVLTEAIADTLAPSTIAVTAPVVGIRVAGRKARSVPKPATPVKVAAVAKA